MKRTFSVLLTILFLLSFVSGAYAQKDIWGRDVRVYRNLYVYGSIFGFGAEAFKIPDTDASNFLTFDWGENDSVDRVLDFRVVGASRILSIEGDSNINQDLTTDASATLEALTLTNAGTGTALTISGAIDADTQVGFAQTLISADTDGDDVYGFEQTLNTGTGTLDTGDREAFGIKQNITVAADYDSSDYWLANVQGLYAVGTVSGDWASAYGQNNYFTVSGDSGSAVGVRNTVLVSGGDVGEGDAGGVGVYNLMMGTSDSDTQNLKGVASTLLTYDTDEAYHSYASDHPSTTGGTQYGYYADLDSGSSTNYSYYAEVGSGESRFGSPTRFGDLTTNYTNFGSDGTVTLVGSAKVTQTVRLPLENFRKGGTAPTETVKGNIAGFLFDADAEILYVQFCVPKNWDAVSDLLLRLYCVLNAGETANDDIDWESTVTPVADHENTGSAGTQTPSVDHDIAALNADADVHFVDLTIDYDDGTAPVVANDIVWIALSRTSNVGQAGYVAGVLLTDVCLVYVSDKMGE